MKTDGTHPRAPASLRDTAPKVDFISPRRAIFLNRHTTRPKSSGQLSHLPDTGLRQLGSPGGQLMTRSRSASVAARQSCILEYINSHRSANRSSLQNIAASTRSQTRSTPPGEIVLWN